MGTHFLSSASLTCIKAAPPNLFSAPPTLHLKQLRPCKPSRPPLSCHASLQPSLLGPCNMMLLLLMLPPLLLQMLLPLLKHLQLMLLLQLLQLLMLQHLLLRQLLPLLQNNSGMILLFDEYSLVLG